jgi:rhamnose transport system permease protein
VAVSSERTERAELAPGGVSDRRYRLVNLIGRIRELSLLAVLAVIVLVVSVQEPRFVTAGNIRQILLSVSILAIVAVGQTVVVVTRNVDLSVGSMVGLTAYLTADLLAQRPGLPLVAVLALGCLLGVAMGALNGLLVTVGRVPAIVATLGTLYIYRGVDFVVAGGKQVNAADVPQNFLDLATGSVAGIPNLILFAAVVAAIGGAVLRSTRSGRQLYGIGSNSEAARLAGIRSGRLVFAAFATCGLLCGLAGVLWSARFATVDARAATGLELLVVAAVVVGGVNIFGGSGTVLGAVLGAILLGTIENSLTLLHLSQFWLQAVSGAAILAAVTADALITRRVQRILLRRSRP